MTSEKKCSSSEFLASFTHTWKVFKNFYGAANVDDICKRISHVSWLQIMPSSCLPNSHSVTTNECERRWRENGYMACSFQFWWFLRPKIGIRNCHFYEILSPALVAEHRCGGGSKRDNTTIFDDPSGETCGISKLSTVSRPNLGPGSCYAKEPCFGFLEV